MFGKYFLVCLIHFSLVIVIVRSLILILPCHITTYCCEAANFLLSVVIAKWTLGYSRKLLLNGKVQPEGKAILITGCARGVGNKVAKHLDSKGFHVFASCLNSDSPGADDLRKNSSSRLKVLQLDVTNDGSVSNAVKFVKANLGSNELWAVINNGGIQKGFLTELTSIQDFKDTVEVNAIGQVRVTKAFLPLLRECRGRVINVASLGGRTTVPMCGPYTISKFASIGFSDCLRHELNLWGMPVISIEPEFFETDLVKKEYLMKRVDDAFASVTEEIRQDYGEEFLKSAKKCFSTAFPPSPNMYRVLHDIESAVCLQHPETVYKTCRNTFFKLILSFFESCPVEWQIFMTNIYYRMCGLTDPKKAKKTDKNGKLK